MAGDMPEIVCPAPNGTMVGERLSLPLQASPALQLSARGLGSRLPAVHAWKDTLETIRCSTCG